MAPPYGDNDGSDQQPAGLLAADFGTGVMMQPRRLHLSGMGTDSYGVALGYICSSPLGWGGAALPHIVYELSAYLTTNFDAFALPLPA